MATYNGTDGNDTLTGSDADDQLNGGEGNDILDGRGGTDALSGGAGDDILVQTGSPFGAESFDGGAGTDTIRFDPSPSPFFPFWSLTGVGFNTATMSSIERLEFGSTPGSAMQVGLPFAMVGSGLAADAELIGGEGADTLLLLASGGGDFTMPNFVRTNWNLDLSPVASMPGVTDAVVLFAIDDANYTLRASSIHSGAESLIGGGGNDVLIGGDGTESLSGGAGGADKLFGGGGTDFLGIQDYPSAAPTDYHDDLFDGGDGIDYLSVSGSQFYGPVFFAGEAVSIEGIRLEPALYFDGFPVRQAAHLVMSSTTALQFGPDVRVQGQGAITINIQPGDTIDLSHAIFEDGADVAFWLIGSEAADTVIGSAGSDYYYSDDYYYGSRENDNVSGREGDDAIYTGNGDDTLDGGDGDDQLESGAGDDVLRGGAGNDDLYGDRGNDTLEGGKGDDELQGSAGDDTLDGGEGSDTAIFDSDRANYHIVDMGDGSYQFTDLRSGSDWLDGTDTIRNFEFVEFDDSVMPVSLLFASGVTITGTAGADIISATKAIAGQPLPTAVGDTLYGLDGNDRLDGGRGADTMYGGAGDDIYTVDDAGDEVIELEGQGVDSVSASVYFMLGANIENLSLTGTSEIDGSGNALDNRIVGNAARNALFGNDGNDILIGGAGADILIGGTGNDSYMVDDVGDEVWEYSDDDQGIDSVSASVSFMLGGGVENLSLSGATAIDGTGNWEDNRIVGNAAANILTGLGGNDALIGGAGADTLIGGQGNDSYTVDDAADQVIELDAEGTDSVSASVSFTLGANVENLSLSGAGAIDGTGNALDNRLVGNAAANILSGGDGNDALTGGAGDDRLIGGAGLDTLAGGLGADRFIFLAASDSGVAAKDKISDFKSAESDLIDLTLIDADSATLGDQAFTFIGTAAFSHHAGELRYAISGTTATLSGDTDGNGIVDFAITLTGVTSLAAGDLIL